MATLKCPKCKGTHIQLWNDDVNMKTHTKTTLNLNPLKPFTIFNHKKVKKRKDIRRKNRTCANDRRNIPFGNRNKKESTQRILLYGLWKQMDWKVRN